MSAGGHSFHKKDWALTALAVAAAATGAGAAGIGPLAGAFGGGAGAAGAAGAGAAEGVGAGLLGGGTAASAFGPSAGFASSLLAPEAATPLITSMATTPAVGGSSMFGAGMAADTLGGFGITPAMSDPSLWQRLQGADWKKGLQALQKAQDYQKLSQPQGQQQPMMQRPQTGGGGSGNELQQLSSLFSNPAGQEALKRILRMQGIQV